MKLRNQFTAVLIALATLGLCAVPLRAQQIKLYLKNGNYELVKSYQIKGDRVRYYSQERSDWEEIPKSMVDFTATRRAAQTEQAEQQKQVEEAKKIEQQRFEPAPNTGFEIKPGVKLPADAGVYAYDGSRVIRLIQSSAEIVNDKKRAALIMVMPAPLLKRESLAVLSGSKAAVRVTMAQPTFYIQSDDNWAQQAELLPLVSKKNQRVVEQIRMGPGIGDSGEQRKVLPLERKRLAAGVYELRPLSPLKPGEYAIGELIGNDKLNLDVWAFGIDPPGGTKPSTK